MSLTTKTPEHAVLAYNLPRGRAVDRGKVAEETIAQAEAPHAAQPAEAAEADADDGLSLVSNDLQPTYYLWGLAVAGHTVRVRGGFSGFPVSVSPC